MSSDFPIPVVPVVQVPWCSQFTSKESKFAFPAPGTMRPRLWYATVCFRCQAPWNWAHGGFLKWGYPKSWMVDFVEIPNLTWRISGGIPRKPPNRPIGNQWPVILRLIMLISSLWCHSRWSDDHAAASGPIRTRIYVTSISDLDPYIMFTSWLLGYSVHVWYFWKAPEPFNSHVSHIYIYIYIPTFSMYGIFTYMTGWIVVQMLVNMPYMEHMGYIYIYTYTHCVIIRCHLQWPCVVLAHSHTATD